VAIMLDIECIFRRALPGDAAAIVKLVNAANGGDGGMLGWTHEASYFEGRRTDAAEVLAHLAAPGSEFVLRIDGDEIIGCAYLTRIRAAAYMGFLAVRPVLQARGIGTQLIRECERTASEEWQCPTMLISVMTSHRPELTAFYERRGFTRTGRFKTLERNLARGQPKVAGMAIEWMEKEFAANDPIAARRPAPLQSVGQ
jgi:ribosomal protein S18 acetylase RimI-like enzyme